MPINPELMKLANGRAAMEKSAIVPSQAAAGGDPAAMGAAPPQDPAAMGAAPPQDPAAMGGMPPMSDPSMMGGLPPAPAAAPAPAEQPAQQKLKPEQMMQMIDYRMYNMQQILTAMANALGVQIDPAVLILPPGTAGAPPAETALPGGPMAPQPQQPPQDPNAAAGGMPPEAMPKQAFENLWGRVNNHSATRIGTPIGKQWRSEPAPIALHVKAAAAQELQKSKSSK